MTLTMETTLTYCTLPTPVGDMQAVCGPRGLVLLEFCDRFSDERNRRFLRKRFGEVPMLEGDLPEVRAQLADYFAGRRREFTLPLDAGGTPFQGRVWEQLTQIPHGSTRSYQQVAERLGQPTAMRAVARANGQNPLAIVVPCHRVIGSDGSLTGYGGGLWRKEWLLKHER